MENFQICQNCANKAVNTGAHQLGRYFLKVSVKHTPRKTDNSNRCGHDFHLICWIPDAREENIESQTSYIQNLETSHNYCIQGANETSRITPESHARQPEIV